MAKANSGQFQKTLALSDNALRFPQLYADYLRRGQWVTANGAKGQFIGIDYNNIIYVAWYMRGMTMRERNAKLQRMTTAYLNLITDQELEQQRIDDAAFRRDTHRQFIRNNWVTIAAMLIVTLLAIILPVTSANAPQHTNGDTARQYLLDHAIDNVLERYNQTRNQ